MALNLYQSIVTKNSRLAAFFDENHNMALLVKKMIGHLTNIAHEWKVDASTMTFEITGSPDGKIMLIKIGKK